MSSAFSALTAAYALGRPSKSAYAGLISSG